MNKILVEVSVGELFDKISILEIKKEKIKDPKKLKHINDEYNILDEQLNFESHAADTLKSCWYKWNKFRLWSGRKWGLNTSTIMLLFRTMVLTKLLYASPIWLYKNIAKFRDFWSRVILTLSGAMFHPPRLITELALQLPPLNITLDIVTTKFILKCLSCQDDTTSCILQIQENIKHPYYIHTILAKKYLAWKSTQKSNVMPISLYNQEAKDLVYTKQDMSAYLSYTWTKRVANQLDVHVPRQLINLSGFSNLSLFTRSSNRITDCLLMDYIHGRSTDFQNFAFTLKKDDSPTSPICKMCNMTSDSPFHQLFSCTTFQGIERYSLEDCLNLDKELYLYEIIFPQSAELLTKFKDMILYIKSFHDAGNTREMERTLTHLSEQ